MDYALVGAHDSSVILNFNVGAGAGGDNNYVVLPFHYNVINGADANNSKALLNDIRANGNPTLGITSINQWDQDTGVWTAQSPGPAPFKWVLEPGEAYRYVATASVDWTCPVTMPQA